MRYEKLCVGVYVSVLDGQGFLAGHGLSRIEVEGFGLQDLGICWPCLLASYMIILGGLSF